MAPNQLQHRLLAERVGDDLESPALLDEQTFEQVRGPGGAAMTDRQPEMSDAGLEVIDEAGDRIWKLSLVVGDQAIGELTGDPA